MVEPAKPFACTMPDCGQTFTNEDHLHVHTKKHDMVLQFGMEQKAAFVADQTPTPTRFIRNCEEVGLFQDLQNVNPFDEGFKRAMESKQGMEGGMTTPTDELHTPQMFPVMDPTDPVFATNQRNVTISRSSSDESGAIKELETTTISKLTNQVTTISRIVEKHDEILKSEEIKKETVRKDSVLYNNVTNIKILSNVEIKPVNEAKERDKEYLQVPPIMSQQSIDKVVDSLTSDYAKDIKKEDYEVTIKLPSGQKIKLTTEDVKPENPKELLKKVLTEKAEVKNNLPPVLGPGVIPFGNGTLIPVSIVNTTTVIPKVPLKVFDKRPVKRKKESLTACKSKEEIDRECRKAASKRHREKDKLKKMEIKLENYELKKSNERLKAENAGLKSMILQHTKKCLHSEDFSNFLSINEKCFQDK